MCNMEHYLHSNHAAHPSRVDHDSLSKQKGLRPTGHFELDVFKFLREGCKIPIIEPKTYHFCQSFVGLGQ